MPSYGQGRTSYQHSATAVEELTTDRLVRWRDQGGRARARLRTAKGSQNHQAAATTADAKRARRHR